LFGSRRQCVHLVEGITVNGSIRFHESEDVAITRTTVNTTLNGIWAQRRAQQSYFADNVVNGPSTCAGSPAENAATPIPNVNDERNGPAADLGAYEVGAPLPVYGPR
jgi:hypothetical protein